MALLHVTHKSTSLGKQMDFNILAPEKWQDNMKILYLLHGHSDNYSAWLTNTAIGLYAMGKNLAIVMPDGGRSFYANLISDENYFDYVGKELQDYVEGMLPFSGKREDRYIAGLSMGGYGALKFALSAPERYMGAASYSGCLDIKAHFSDGLRRFESIWPQPVPEAEDLFYLAKQAATSEQKPIIYQWCGLSDFLYQDNVKFRDFMQEMPFDYHYFESEGNHGWQWWNEQLAKTIAFFGL